MTDIASIAAGLTEAIDELCRAHGVLLMHKIMYPTTPFPIAFNETELAKKRLDIAIRQHLLSHPERTSE